MFRKAPERMGVSAIFGGNRYLIPFNRGIATPVRALARNDSVYLVRTFKQQFFVQRYFGRESERQQSKGEGI